LKNGCATNRYTWKPIRDC